MVFGTDTRNSLKMQPSAHFFGDDHDIYVTRHDGDHDESVSSDSDDSDDSSPGLNQTTYSAMSFGSQVNNTPNVNNTPDVSDDEMSSFCQTSTPVKGGKRKRPSFQSPSVKSAKRRVDMSNLVLEESEMLLLFFSIRFTNIFQGRQGHFCW